MALQEIDEAELLQLRNARAVLDKFGANPKTRQKLMEMVKEINPQAVIPEIDAKNEVLAELEKTKADLAEFKKSLEAEKVEAAKKADATKVEDLIATGRKKLKASGYTEDGITGIEKLMNERGIADYDAAAALFDKEHPQEEPITPTDYGKNWNFAKPDDGDEDHKLLLSDPMQFQQKQIRKFMADQRAGRR